MFQRSLIGVSMKYQGCFMQVSWIGSFNGVSRKFQKSFKGVLREFLEIIQGSFRAVQMQFPWCFKKVSRVLQKCFWCGSFRVC